MNRTGIRLIAPLLTVLAISTMAPVTLIAEGQGSAQPSAQTLLDMATSQAAIDDRHVMVEFRASWCKWCARLKAALHSFELGRIIADNYVLVSLTVQESDDKTALKTPGAQTLMDATGGSQAGLPFYLFIDTEGTLIADSMVMPGGGNIGYPVTSEEIEAFRRLIESTAPRMSRDDQALVAKYLVDHRPEF